MAMLFTMPGPESWNRTEPRVPLNAQQYLVARWGRYFPLYTQHVSLLGSIVSPFSVPEIDIAEGGFMPVTQHKESRIERDIEAHSTLTAETKFEVAEWNRLGLTRLAEVTAEAGVPLYLIVAPAHERLLERDSFQTWVTELSAFYDEFATDYDHVVVLAGEPLSIPHAMTQSADHVTVDGADFYSRFVAERLVQARFADQ